MVAKDFKEEKFNDLDFNNISWNDEFVNKI